MILDHVAQGASFLVIGATPFDADGFGRCNLNMVDIAAIPERLEDAVAEAESQNVLHGLFAEIMIDAIDILLGKNFVDLLIQLPRARQIVAERLFHNNAPPAVSLVHRVPAQSVNHGRVITGLSRKIVQNVAVGLVVVLDFGKLRLDLLIAIRVLQIAGDIVERLFERTPDRFVKRRIFDELLTDSFILSRNSSSDIGVRELPMTAKLCGIRLS